MVRRTVAKYGPNPVDVHVGSRVRLRRTLLGMSQEKLGEALGLTFQQVRNMSVGSTVSALAGYFITMWSLVDGNFGTAFRHRGEVVWAVVVLAAVGAERLLKRRKCSNGHTDS